MGTCSLARWEEECTDIVKKHKRERETETEQSPRAVSASIPDSTHFQNYLKGILLGIFKIIRKLSWNNKHSEITEKWVTKSTFPCLLKIYIKITRCSSVQTDWLIGYHMKFRNRLWAHRNYYIIKMAFEFREEEIGLPISDTEVIGSPVWKI